MGAEASANDAVPATVKSPSTSILEADIANPVFISSAIEALVALSAKDAVASALNNVALATTDAESAVLASLANKA